MALNKTKGYILMSMHLTNKVLIVYWKYYVSNIPLTCSIYKHNSGLRIYIYEESMPLLRIIVKPYMVSSMYYKVGLLV